MSARVILVTGGNGGLGQAIARAFLAESPENVVWLGVRTHRENAESLSHESPGRCRLCCFLFPSKSGLSSALLMPKPEDEQRLDIR